MTVVLLTRLFEAVPAAALPKASRQLLRRELPPVVQPSDQKAHAEVCSNTTGTACHDVCPEVLQALCRGGACVCPSGTCFVNGSCKELVGAPLASAGSLQPSTQGAQATSSSGGSARRRASSDAKKKDEEEADAKKGSDTNETKRVVPPPPSGDWDPKTRGTTGGGSAMTTTTEKPSGKSSGGFLLVFFGVVFVLLACGLICAMEDRIRARFSSADGGTDRAQEAQGNQNQGAAQDQALVSTS
eukprot:TRINITY_DN77434_c0_g1_i1.p1 TRINITY_DN77434_c0_g1~~TRINITY_DN77434_c0_g1_i1.p1  ORF type:complete len:280 (+),score=24.06 TRINITY_DN77434_c0_g1_i1:114-842(+)